MAETECSEPELKKAFLFSCLTGLRKSDVMNLTWMKIQPYGNGKMYYITVRMQKTKEESVNRITLKAPKNTDASAQIVEQAPVEGAAVKVE